MFIGIGISPTLKFNYPLLVMTLRELIDAEFDQLSEQELDELYRIVEQFVIQRKQSNKGGIMSRLRQIKVEAPEDFSASLDAYMNGEKQLSEQSDIH
ncbi:conserved hypothetical protein [Leptolyngbya boryana IAM M-101]|nr:conserved hypothetical protein [Leptolyngbya boryana IAM M-101]BAS63161.1 conserved hypothetical protein [Leptolyngbya boryana dg5]